MQPFVRRLVLLLGILMSACALPGAALADTFSIQSIAPTQISEGQAATVTVTRDARASTRTAVELDGAPIGAPITVEFPAGSTSQAVTVDAPENDVVEPARTFELRLARGTGGGGLTVHDDDVEFGQTAISVREAAGVLRLPFHRLDWTLPVHVTLGYTLGTAGWDDIGPNPPTSLSLPGGWLDGTAALPIARDQVAEPAETFTLALNPPSTAHPPITVTILDSDLTAPTPVVRFGPRPRLRAVLPVTLRADEAGIARLSLSADGRRLAAATTALATSAKRLRLHLDPALVRRLRGHRHVRVVLRVVATDAAGNHRTVVRRLVLTT